MREFTRLLRLFAPCAPWLLTGLLLALLALASQLLTLGSAGQAVLVGTGMIGWLKLAGSARPMLRYAERLLTHSATFRVLARLRLWLFAQLVPLAPQHLGTRRAGDVLARLLTDIETLDGFVLRLLLPVALGVSAATLAVGALVYIHGPATLVATILLGLFLILALWIMRGRAQVITLPERQSDLRVHVLDGCEGLADLLASDAADRQLHRITQASAALNRAQLAHVRLRLGALLSSQLACALILLLLLPAFARMDTGLALSASLITLGALELLPALALAGAHWPLMQTAAARIFDLADTPVTLREPVQSASLPTRRSICFEHVHLHYGRAKAALDAVSVEIPQGARVLISGPSGAGKTSLLNLLLKFATPTQGRILIDGVDLQTLDGDIWRTQLACLTQQTALMAGSVRENLLLAYPQASDAALWDALKAAGLDDFVRSLPDGLECWTGESGAQVSGGQARRLAIAQMLLRDAPIWLLDEPTEGLDAATAQSVMATLAARSHGKTVLLITHQPELADRFGITHRLTLQRGRLLS